MCLLLLLLIDWKKRAFGALCTVRVEADGEVFQACEVLYRFISGDKTTFPETGAYSGLGYCRLCTLDVLNEL